MWVVGLVGFMVIDRGMAPVRIADVVAAALVLGTAVWVAVIGLVVPAVRASDDELVVRQPLSEWRVRWSSVTLPFGDDVRFRLSDGRVIHPWAFSPSIVAELLGDRAKVRMFAHLRDREIAGVGEPGGIRHTWKPRIGLWVSSVVVWLLWFGGLALIGGVG